MAALLTDAPWTVDAEDLAGLSAVGLSDEGVVQAVTIAAIFNHLVRTADGTGIEFDYESALPRLQVDRGREPVPRPDPSAWPRVAPRLPRSLRPATMAAIEAWRAFLLERSDVLPRRDRAVIARTAAFHNCDAVGVEAWAGAAPGTARERALAAYAEKLTVTPWRMAEADLGPLRALGLDDRGVLHVIAGVGLQNMLSRLQLALG
jgi:alkylhydroperoxidase family enzyme